MQHKAVKPAAKAKANRIAFEKAPAQIGDASA
jgi:hypothetical protein